MHYVELLQQMLTCLTADEAVIKFAVKFMEYNFRHMYPKVACFRKEWT